MSLTDAALAFFVALLSDSVYVLPFPRHLLPDFSISRPSTLFFFVFATSCSHESARWMTLPSLPARIVSKTRVRPVSTVRLHTTTPLHYNHHQPNHPPAASWFDQSRTRDAPESDEAAGDEDATDASSARTYNYRAHALWSQWSRWLEEEKQQKIQTYSTKPLAPAKGKGIDFRSTPIISSGRDVEARAARTEDVGDQEASTSSLDPYADYMRRRILPRTEPRMRVLVRSACTRGRFRLVDSILNQLQSHSLDRELAKSLEAAALIELLNWDVRLPSVKNVRSDAAEDVNPPPIGMAPHLKHHELLPPSRYHDAWDRLWNLQGPSKLLSPKQAAHILHNLIYTTRPQHADIESRQIPALIHLLELAGIEENHELALDVLVQASLPRVVGADASRASLLEPGPPSSFQHIFSIFELLLKDRVITSTAIREFHLQEIMAESGNMPIETFQTCLSQALLRVAIRCYANEAIFDRALLLLRYLQPLEETLSTEEVIPECVKAVTLHDRDLFHSVCAAALSPGQGSKWLASTAMLLTECLVGKLRVWETDGASEQQEVAEEVSGRSIQPDEDLLQMFLDTALPKQVHRPTDSQAAASAALVIKAALDARLPLEALVASPRRVLPVLQALSTPGNVYDPDSLASKASVFRGPYDTDLLQSKESHCPVSSFAQTQLDVAAELWRSSKASKGAAGSIMTNVEANRFLQALLQSVHNVWFLEYREDLRRATMRYYQELSSSPFPLGDKQSFHLITPILSPLVTAIADFDTPNGTVTARTSRQCEAVIKKFVQDKRQVNGRLGHTEMTAVAEAYLAMDAFKKALFTVDAVFLQKSVPSKIDIRIVLVAFARSRPRRVLDLLADMCQTGYRVDLETARAVLMALPCEVRADLVDVLLRHSDESDVDRCSALERLQRDAQQEIGTKESRSSMHRASHALHFLRTGGRHTGPGLYQEIQPTHSYNTTANIERQLDPRTLYGNSLASPYDIMSQVLLASIRYSLAMDPRALSGLLERAIAQRCQAEANSGRITSKQPSLVPVLVDYMAAMPETSYTCKTLAKYYSSLRCLAVKEQDRQMARQLYDLSKRRGVDDTVDSTGPSSVPTLSSNALAEICEMLGRNQGIVPECFLFEDELEHFHRLHERSRVLIGKGGRRARA